MRSSSSEHSSPSSRNYRVEGSGPLLIYVPGLDGTGELFFKQRPILARRYRVLTFRSRDGGEFSYDDLAEDIAAMIQENAEERAIIVGESFGGTVALSFALRHPEMVERLVVVNSFPVFRGRLRIRLAALLALYLPFRATWPVRVVASFLGLIADGVNSEDRRRVFAALRTVEPKSYARRLELIARFDVEERLQEIQAHTLFIAGEKDLLIRSASEAKIMAGKMSRAAVRVIEGAGHACLIGSRVNLAEILEEMMNDE